MEWATHRGMRERTQDKTEKSYLNTEGISRQIHQGDSELVSEIGRGSEENVVIKTMEVIDSPGERGAYTYRRKVK